MMMLLPLYHHHLHRFSTNQHSLKRFIFPNNTTTTHSRTNIRKRSLHRSPTLQKHEILSLNVPTFDGKWMLPSHVHYHIPSSSSSSSSRDNSSDDDAIVLSSSLTKTTSLPPILLLCGWAGAGTCDWGLLPKLISYQTKRHVITFDPRGIGNAIQNTTHQYNQGETHPHPQQDQYSKERITFDSMALDALAVIQTYYQTIQKMNAKNEKTNASKSSNNCDSKMTFCVGGVSMGGIVAQHIAHMTSTSSCSNDDDNMVRETMEDNPIVPKPLHEQFEVSSLGLICTSLAKHIIPSKQKQQHHQDQWTKILHNDNHFLNSFDQWPSSSSSSSLPSSSTKSELDDLDQLKLQYIQNFFNAMGDSFLAKPGRKTLQTKLMKGYIQTRKEFVNGNSNQAILQQKNLLLKYYAHVFHNDDSNHDNSAEYDSIDTTDMIGLDAMKWRQDVPFIIIHGDEDRVIPVSHAKVMHSYLQSDSHTSDVNQKKENLIILNECDHLCWITHGHEVAKALGNFWAKRKEC